MLANLKRWFARDEAPSLPWADVEAWARTAGHRFARAREAAGFVVDASHGSAAAVGGGGVGVGIGVGIGVGVGREAGAETARPWRLEWGPPQRAYLAAAELRIRLELGLPAGLQMLLMSRGLMESLESEIFERSTQDLETHIDMSTPEEMRWLSMYAKSPVSTDRAVRAHFAGLANDPAALAAWADDGLVQHLKAAVGSGGLLAAGAPFLLMTLRGRLYLRMQLEAVGAPAVAQAVELFEAALTSALQFGASPRADGDGRGDRWPRTGGTAWQSQYPPTKN